MDCGSLEMFVDLFPRDIGAIPPPIEIEPRTPLEYQMRVVIWNVRNAISKKRSFGSPVCCLNFGESLCLKAADLYVKCYLNGQNKGQKTDVHYRVLDGSGSFNWRLVFDLEYNVWEQKLVVRKKNRVFRHFFLFKLCVQPYHVWCFISLSTVEGC